MSEPFFLSGIAALASEKASDVGVSTELTSLSRAPFHFVQLPTSCPSSSVDKATLKKSPYFYLHLPMSSPLYILSF